MSSRLHLFNLLESNIRYYGVDIKRHVCPGSIRAGRRHPGSEHLPFRFCLIPFGVLGESVSWSPLNPNIAII